MKMAISAGVTADDRCSAAVGCSTLVPGVCFFGQVPFHGWSESRLGNPWGHRSSGAVLWDFDSKPPLCGPRTVSSGFLSGVALEDLLGSLASGWLTMMAPLLDVRAGTNGAKSAPGGGGWCPLALLLRESSAIPRQPEVFPLVYSGDDPVCLPV